MWIGIATIVQRRPANPTCRVGPHLVSGPIALAMPPRRPGFPRRGRRDYSTLLWNVNNLLTAVGIPAMKIRTLGELTRVASSMFVAVYESLFHSRLEGVIRGPRGKEDYVSNVQRVIDALSGEIQMDLSHIQGKAIVEGDPRSLSNLIHIFIRIIAITGSQESQSTVDDVVFDETGAAIGGGGGGAGADGESISTHESTFAQTNFAGPSLQRPGVIDAVLRGSSDAEVRKMCEQDARKLLLTTEAQIRQSERAEAARLRKATLMHARESKCEIANRKCEETKARMQQQRWLEECERAAEAYKQRQESEGHTMLRQIYRGLLQKLGAWRRSEKQEAKDNVARMRDDAKNYILSLQAHFEDRVKLLQEQSGNKRRDAGIHTRAQRKQGTQYKRMYENDNQQVLNTQQDKLSQRRSAQLLKEKEGHQHLLSLLAIDKWENSLRT